MCLHSAINKCLKSMTLSALGVILGGALAGSAVAQNADRLLLGSTPLILKDGRIANVSVHVFPFRGGASELATRAARELAVLTYDVATDCFLTAQVIGHVGPSEVSGNDTLNAHRLARARADAVQASLIDGGLPAKAIASVWDWQFMVREPRATLWLFRLVEGEDCEGTPLDSRAPLAVARNEPASERAETQRRPASGSSQASRSMTELANRASERMSADERAAASAETRGQERGRDATAVPAGPAPNESARQATRSVPASSPTDRPSDDQGQSVASRTDDDTRDATADQPRQQTAAARPEQPARQAAPERTLVVQFANNSSYFPPGIREQLEALVDGLEPGRSYDVELRVTVSDSTEVVGAKTAEEAERYNQWLANRRLERVQNWLDNHARDAELAIETEFVRGDDRQVRIRVAPAA